MVFSGGKINDSLWAFNGSNLHEGGYRFAMTPLTDSSWLLKGFNLDEKPDDHAEPIVGKRGDHVFYQVVDGPRNYRLISWPSPGTSPSKEQARRNSPSWRN